jgi:Tfp pilus assembly protein PilO
MMRRAPLIGLLVVALLAVGFYFGLSRPKAAERDALVAETASLETKAQELELEIARLGEVRDAETEITAALDRLGELITVGVEQATSLELFQESADAATVEIITFSFSAPALVEDAPPTGEAGTALHEIPVTMIVEGGYFQTVDFFRRLEIDVSRAILVDSVSVAGAEADFPVLSTTWTGRLFAVMEAPVSEAAEGAPAAPAAGGEATEAPAAGESAPSTESTETPT